MSPANKPYRTEFTPYRLATLLLGALDAASQEPLSFYLAGDDVTSVCIDGDVDLLKLSEEILRRAQAEDGA